MNKKTVALILGVTANAHAGGRGHFSLSLDFGHLLFPHVSHHHNYGHRRHGGHAYRHGYGDSYPNYRHHRPRHGHSYRPHRPPRHAYRPRHGHRYGHGHGYRPRHGHRYGHGHGYRPRHGSSVHFSYNNYYH